MSRIKDWFNYYFVRKKSPLSYILWQDILRREVSTWGMFSISIAKTPAECALSISMGAPKDCFIGIYNYDDENILKDTVEIKLPYRYMKRISNGFEKAHKISRSIE